MNNSHLTKLHYIVSIIQN